MDDQLLGTRHESIDTISDQERALARRYIGEVDMRVPGSLDYALEAGSAGELNRRRKERFGEAQQRFAEESISAKNADTAVLSALISLWQAKQPENEQERTSE